MDEDVLAFDLQARFCQALSSPKRLQILHILGQGEMTTSDLASRVGTSMPNLSQHLAIMRQVGLVDFRREGLNTYYRVSSPEILEACAMVRRLLASRLTKQQQVLERII